MRIYAELYYCQGQIRSGSDGILVLDARLSLINLQHAAQLHCQNRGLGGFILYRGEGYRDSERKKISSFIASYPQS